MRFPLQTKDKGYMLFIWQDVDPPDPREGCLSKMHPRYSLGDENPYSSFTDFRESQEAKAIRVSLPVYYWTIRGCIYLVMIFRTHGILTA